MPDIKLGRFYLNATRDCAREVAELDSWLVVYHSYAFPSGSVGATGRHCTLTSFARWVGGSLADEEAERFRALTRPGKADHEWRYMHALVEGLPDFLLLMEVRRRNLSLD